MASDFDIEGYRQLVSTYQAIDNFRSQLLGRLPLATGAGIFLLYYGKDGISNQTKAFLPAIGLFGFIVTLGLFVYEYFGITKCHALLKTGRRIEIDQGIEGQFRNRPISIFNEPFAAGLIYPAVMAAWVYLGLAFVNTGAYLWIAPLVFLVFFAIMGRYNLMLYLEVLKERAAESSEPIPAIPPVQEGNQA